MFALGDNPFEYWELPECLGFTIGEMYAGLLDFCAFIAAPKLVGDPKWFLETILGVRGERLFQGFGAGFLCIFCILASFGIKLWLLFSF